MTLHRTGRLCAVLLLAVAAAAGGSVEEQQPRLPEADRVRLTEAFRLIEDLREEVWPGWSHAPMAVLLVTAEHEFLLRHPRPGEDFTSLGHDALLDSDVSVRARQYAPNLLATFPAVGGVSTIVIGQPEATGLSSSTRWVVTVAHEHFHQWQDSQPGAYAAYDSLGLARGDTTGMWMLNFPFPYEEPAVSQQFAALCAALAKALDAGEKDFPAALAAYRRARAQFQEALGEDDYRYFSFQLWKEGVARYTEYRVAQLAAERFKPSEAFRALPDFAPFALVAEATLARIRRQLQDPALEQRKRTAFYAVGAAEALLLDRANPAWKQRYLSEKFFLDRYLPE